MNQSCAGLNRALLTKQEIEVWSSDIMKMSWGHKKKWSKPVMSYALTLYNGVFHYKFEDDGVTHKFSGAPDNISYAVRYALEEAEQQRVKCEAEGE